jgi:acetylornithine aminotransferase
MVQRRQGLVVVDEVTTGMGRAGAWYGFEHYRLEPDVVALGKGLGNGYPVSAVAMTRDVAQGLEESGFHYAQSHQNDPLGCAVAREVIGVIRELGLIERSERVGAHLLGELRRVAERRDGVREVRGRGLMIAMELERGMPAISVYSELLERGFIVGCKPAANLLRFYPPLIIGEEEIAGLLESLDQVLGSLNRDR